ncbi:TIR domain-containing protein [Lysinibacillus sp. NPDC093688]|uniref:TIR domain-containing protein n=1 Tax=Lysinibacillus sp. NPDC093688 TaxID=3390577 RepID=UPI003D080982
MDNSKKRELINNLIEEMQNMEYQSGSSNLSDFLATGEVILTKIFSQNSSHTEKFKKVKFTPGMIALGADNTSTYISSFQRGKTSMISVLNGAVKEIELEEEFFPSTPSLPLDTEVAEPTKSNKVFIVHGHDVGLKNEVARFVEKLGFEAVILHEQVSKGKTIIEKIEEYSEVGFAIILYTPCDEGKAKSSEHFNSRARQNVVFEHGYFTAKLGRNNVVALHKGENLELPNDISGVVYVKYEDGTWKTQIADEMDASGYQINYRLVR